VRSDTARKLKAAAQPVSAPDPIVDPRWVEFGRPPEYYTPQFGEFHESFMQRVESRLVHRRAAIAANLPSSYGGPQPMRERGDLMGHQREPDS
jgi:hypothetical protein